MERGDRPVAVHQVVADVATAEGLEVLVLGVEVDAGFAGGEQLPDGLPDKAVEELAHGGAAGFERRQHGQPPLGVGDAMGAGELHDRQEPAVVPEHAGDQVPLAAGEIVLKRQCVGGDDDLLDVEHPTVVDRPEVLGQGAEARVEAELFAAVEPLHFGALQHHRLEVVHLVDVAVEQGRQRL